ncbi:DUF317 domain-containing protein [Streptomyces sp. OE57]|uniref:DUF317 domain-containing protein n=1 Tax=Streptomyces lacaronensis TaxID=3379885 RepID=UPI0039B75B45
MIEPVHATDPGDHDAILNEFLAAHDGWEKWRTWSDDTTHAIHESQTLRIERVHEAHPHETAWTAAAPAPVLRALLQYLADGAGGGHAMSHPADEKAVVGVTTPFAEAGWTHNMDGRWIRWTNPAGEAGIQLDAFAAQQANSSLPTWTIWAGPDIDHPTWTLTASPHTSSRLLASIAESIAHGTATHWPTTRTPGRVAYLGTTPPTSPTVSTEHMVRRAL